MSTQRLKLVSIYTYMHVPPLPPEPCIYLFTMLWSSGKSHTVLCSDIMRTQSV